MTIEQDATEFGLHVRAGGWRLALLVARNVKEGEGQGARKPRGNRPEVKVSAREFATMAGLGDHKRVLRYLRAWDARSNLDGAIPASSTLLPGDDVELDEEVLGPIRLTEIIQPKPKPEDRRRPQPEDDDEIDDTEDEVDDDEDEENDTDLERDLKNAIRSNRAAQLWLKASTFLGEARRIMAVTEIIPKDERDIKIAETKIRQCLEWK